MKLKLDENLSRHLKPQLAALGYDVSTAADEALLSRLDIDIADAAQAENRAVVTLDLDFADISRFPPGSHPGVFLFRPKSLSPIEVNRRIVEFCAQPDVADLARCLVVVEVSRVRIRRPDSR
jgi:predicted nuclease of predicted toxin-antitoxin system